MKAKRWLYPAAAAREYEKNLRRLAKAVVSQVETALRHRQDSDDWYTEWNRVLMDLPRQMALPLAQAQLQVGLSADEVSRFNKRQFRDVVRSAYGADLIKPDPDLSATLANWTAANTALIKSIPEEYAKKVQHLVQQAAVNGTSQAELIKQIRKTYKLPHDRARLIANDQIGKLNGQLTRMRQQDIGITHYRWRGTLDSRERDSHLRREGKVFAWDKPPSGGHPGSEIRCRCHAEPIFPELADLDAALFGDGGDNRHYHAEMTRRGLKPEAGMPDLPVNPYEHYGFVPRGTDLPPPPIPLPAEPPQEILQRSAGLLARASAAAASGTMEAMLAGLDEAERALLLQAIALINESQL